MNQLNQKASVRLALLTALILSAICPAPLPAAGPVASLDVVPADAAFYSAWLRNREKYDKIVNSKAFAKIRDLPYVQMGLGMYQLQTTDVETIPGKITAAMSNPEMRKSLEFATDLFSDEVFIYAGANSTKLIELGESINGALRASSFVEGIQGGIQSAKQRAKNQPPATPPNNEEAQGRALVQALVNQMDLIEVPELVIGCKVKDKARAEKLLAALEPGLQKAFDQEPELKGRFKRQAIAGHSYLTLTLEGGMTPWPGDVVEKIRSLAATPDDGDKLIEHLKKAKLVISLGLRDDFLLLAISPSTDVFAHMGGASPLRSLPELAAVAKFADKPITSVGYFSKKLNRQFSATKAEIDDLAQSVKGMLPNVPIEKLRGDLAKTIDELAGDIKKAVTEIGGSSSIAFFTPEGTETYGYDWSDYPQVVYSKPLDILKHIGGNPIAVVAERGKVSIDDYDLIVKWIRTSYRYLDEYGAPEMQPKERKQYDEVIALLKPLAARLDKTTREQLLPGLADGQSAIVLDAKLTSRQFVKSIPPTEKPLPMLEPAIVVGVSDAAKVRKAFTEYYAMADDFVDVLKTIDRKQPQRDIPDDFKLPRPKVYHLSSGDAWGYVFPAEWGVDSRIMPNAGISEKVAVLSLSGRHTQRLLTEKEPVVAGIKLPTEGAFGGVAAIDFAALVDAATPWVDLALDEALKNGPSQQDADNVRLHAKAVLEVLKCYRGTVAETYREGNVTVTRTRSQYQDVAE